MQNTLKNFTIITLLATTLIACSNKSDEIEIPVSETPTNIITLVQNILPGISITKTEKGIKRDAVIYQLEGKLINGKEYEIKISEDGTIIKIKLED